MAGRNTISSEKLKKLGVQRLADLLVELSTGNSKITSRLKMELTGDRAPEKMVKDLEERLAKIKRTTKFIKISEELAFSVELDAQRKAIVETLPKSNPQKAYNLLWEFIRIAPFVYNRCLGSGKHIDKVFAAADGNIAELAKKSKLEASVFAQHLITMCAGFYMDWPVKYIELSASALGKKGLEYMNSKFIEILDAVSNGTEEQFLANNTWLTMPPAYIRRNEDLPNNIESALCKIADIRDDMDGYVKYYNREMRDKPSGINDIAGKFLKLKMAKDALKLIDSVDFDGLTDNPTLLLALKDKEITALELLKKKEEAQKKRKQCFYEHLSAKQLRAYIDKLPDFDDLEAEEEALNFVANHENKLQALNFLAAWPSLNRVAKIVEEHDEILATENYEPLIPIAEALSADYPVASIHVYRAVLNTMLESNQPAVIHKASQIYKQSLKLLTGNRNLGDCSVENELINWLKEKKPRKRNFWQKIYGDQYRKFM